MAAASAIHSTDGVVVFALCDQGAKHSTFKN